MTAAAEVAGTVVAGRGGAAAAMRARPGAHWAPLGYRPHPGSLNLRVSAAGREQVLTWPAVHVGGVDNRPVTARGVRCHARTVRDKRTVELVASVPLRDVLGLADGDTVTLVPTAAPTRVIVQAAGGGRRWREHTGVPKHLLTVAGERLIDRTVRLVRGHGIRDVVVAAPPGDDRYAVPGARLWPKVAAGDVEADAWLPAESWNPAGRTLWLLGDAYYTAACLDQIIAYDPLDWTWYLRYRETRWRGWTRTKAILGYSMWPAQHQFFAERVASLVALQRTGALSRSAGYELYRWMCGEPAADVAHRVDTPGYRWRGYPPRTWTPPADDATCDFDRPKHLSAWLARFDPGRDA